MSISSHLIPIPAVTNEFTNPSFETSTAAFSVNDFLGLGVTGPTIIYDAWVGSRAIRYVFNDSGLGLFQDPTYTTVVEADELNAGIAFRGTPGTLVTLHFWYLNNTTSIGTSDDVTVAITDAWQLYVFPTGSVPAGVNRAKIELSVTNPVPGPITLDIDGVDVRHDGRFDTYVDGDQDIGSESILYYWEGTAHASRSFRRAVMPATNVGVGGVVRTYSEVFACDVLGNEADDLTDYVLDGETVTDIDRSIKSSISLNVRDVTPFNAYEWVKVYRNVYRETEGSTARYPLGIFQLLQPSAEWLSGQGKVTGLDPTILLAESFTRDTYNIAAGVSYVAAIRAIIDAIGLVGRHAIPDDARVLPTGGKTWPSGTSYLEIVNFLLDAIGMYTLFMLTDGRLGSMPYVDRNTIAPAYVWNVGDDAQIVGQIEESTNDDNVYNYVIVTKTDNSQITTSAYAENESVSHPYSTVNLGAKAGIAKRYKVKKVEFNEAADTPALQAKADETLQRASMLHYVNLDIMPIYDHTPHQTAKLAFEDSAAAHLSGAYYIEYYAISFGASDTTTVKLRRTESTK